MICRLLNANDVESLAAYFNALGQETRRRYGPPPFDITTAEKLCKGDDSSLLCYVAEHDTGIVAYTVVKKGYLHFEEERYQAYGLELNHDLDFTIAPSVADAWQSKGVGSQLMEFVLSDLKKRSGGKGKVLLWGGVQETNDRARNFYVKFGFNDIGWFEHNGGNIDMVLRFA